MVVHHNDDCDDDGGDSQRDDYGDMATRPTIYFFESILPPHILMKGILVVAVVTMQRPTITPHKHAADAH